jgi:leucyl-tRNA synthetase
MNGLVGVRRFLERTWNLQDKISATSTPSAKLTTALHQTIKKMTEDIEAMRFNTAVAKLMELINVFSEAESLPREYVGIFARLLSPFAPHLCEELWQALGNTGSISTAAWPTYDPNSIADTELTIAIQINGKVRDTITVPADATEETIKVQALGTEKVKGWLEGKEPKKVIYVKGKLISIVV